MKSAPAMRVDTEYVIVPILRAGLGMSPAGQEVLPHHRVCLGGTAAERGKHCNPTYILTVFPSRLEGMQVVLCDPMLATGGSLVCVLDMLATRSAGAVTVLCLVAARPGVAFVHERHPNVKIVAAALDDELNAVGYITPGLGDAGDRLFGPPVH